MVPFAEIEKNEYNLNIPAISTVRKQRTFRILKPICLGHSNADIEALENYWTVYLTLKSAVFGKSKRPSIAI